MVMRANPTLHHAAIATGCFGLGALAALLAHAAVTVPTGIGYSGTLKNSGAAVNGTHRFDFDLVDGANATVGCPTDTRAALAVNEGRFDVTNLFGSCSNLDG